MVAPDADKDHLILTKKNVKKMNGDLQFLPKDTTTADI